MPSPAFTAAIVIIAAVMLIAKSAPHRRVRVALALWVGSVLFGVFVLGGSGWSSLVSFVLFWSLVFAKGIPMALRTGGGDHGHPALPKP